MLQERFLDILLNFINEGFNPDPKRATRKMNATGTQSRSDIVKSIIRAKRVLGKAKKEGTAQKPDKEMHAKVNDFHAKRGKVSPQTMQALTHTRSTNPVGTKKFDRDHPREKVQKHNIEKREKQGWRKNALNLKDKQVSPNKTYGEKVQKEYDRKVAAGEKVDDSVILNRMLDLVLESLDCAPKPSKFTKKHKLSKKFMPKIKSLKPKGKRNKIP